MLALKFLGLCHFNSSLRHVIYNAVGVTQNLRRMTSVARIIGFAGATNGGKTTVCKSLKKIFPREKVNVMMLSMDNYYWDEDSPEHVMLPEFNNTYANWDDVCSVNWERLVQDVAAWKAGAVSTNGEDKKQLLLVEGILIFNHKHLLPYFDKKYFFTLPKDECWNRRKKRTYLPPEPEGYFEKIAWPYYLKLKQELAPVTDIVYLDGTRSKEDLFEEVKNDIAILLGET